MLKRLNDNAVIRHDYYVLIPVLLIVVLWVHEYLSSPDLTAWIGGMVSILLGMAVLGFAVFYSTWDSWVITGFFVFLTLNSAVEYIACGSELSLGGMAVILVSGFLSSVTVVRRVRDSRGGRKASDG